MNENARPPRGPERAGEGELPDALRWQLRALRRDQPPSRDLWAGIAARLDEQAQAPADDGRAAAAAPAPARSDAAGPTTLVARPRAAARSRWMAPLALAAGVAALAIGLGTHLRSAQDPASPAAGAVAVQPAGQAAPTLVQREAQGMTLQYQAALREVEPASAATVAMKPAFDELDRNAALILDALSHDPDSRMLLEQLRRTYARRLALAQRLAYT